MDAKLAEMYGTNTPDESDLEKLAAAELAEQLSEDGQADLDDLDEDQLEALATEVLAETEDGDDETDESDPEFQEKVAEADHLGRLMAHAYTQEMRQIEKTAAKKGGKGGGKTMGFLAKADKGATDAVNWTGRQAKKGYGHVASGAKAVGRHVSRNRGRYGAGAAAASIGFGAKKGYDKYKKSSALDTLAEQRAYEILEENGVDLEKVAAKKGGKGAAKAGLFQRADKGATDAVNWVGRQAAKGYGHAASGARAVGRHVSRNRGRYGAGGAALALGAGAVGAKKALEKRSSALDTLVEQRALELLAENGVDLEELEAEQEKTSGVENEYDVLAAEVEQRAWNLLAENGFVSEEGEDEQGE
jgi:hypothetical protein